MKGNVGAGLDRAKALGIVVLGFSVFALYLSVANWLFFLNIASLPLGEVINNFLTALIALMLRL